jgi:hypothetical protein
VVEHYILDVEVKQEVHRFSNGGQKNKAMFIASGKTYDSLV